MDRQAVADADNRIDRELRRDAVQKGRGLGTRRILVAHPLAVVFTADPDDRMVRVLKVQRLAP